MYNSEYNIQSGS